MQQIVPNKAGDITRFLDETPFEFYVAYPSIIHSLATHALGQDLTIDHGPPMIFSGAERMYDDQMADIARYTGAEVSQLYGFNEGAANASMCEAGRLHEDFEFGHIECVDPEPDPTGQFVQGRVVATGFAHLGLPVAAV